jgi:hypothetical protein
LDPLIHVLGRLNEHGVEYVVIGGLASVLHGAAVNTLDVAVVMAFTPENVQRLHAALQGINPRFRFTPKRVPLHDDWHDLVCFKNLNLITDLGALDVLGELPGIGTFEEIVPCTVESGANNVRFRMLDLETLIAAKSAAGRPKDKLAVMELQAVKARKAAREHRSDPPPPPYE